MYEGMATHPFAGISTPVKWSTPPALSPNQLQLGPFLLLKCLQSHPTSQYRVQSIVEPDFCLAAELLTVLLPSAVYQTHRIAQQVLFVLKGMEPLLSLCHCWKNFPLKNSVSTVLTFSVTLVL